MVVQQTQETNQAVLEFSRHATNITKSKPNNNRKQGCCSLLAESNTEQNCSESDHVRNLTYSETSFSCLTENGLVDISRRILLIETKLCSL